VSAEYTFRVTGWLTRRLLAALEPLQACAAAGDTLLVGQVTDRAALYGFIARIDALGLELIELQRRPHRNATDGYCPECGRDGVAREENCRATGART
jgi:hypothetical protein